MSKTIITTAAIATLSIAGFSTAYAEEAYAKSNSPYHFVKLDGKANFIYGDNPVLNLPTEDLFLQPIETKNLQQRAADMDIVMVHRNGDTFEAKMKAEDLAIFEHAIRTLESLNGKGPLLNSPGHRPTVKPVSSKGAEHEEIDPAAVGEDIDPLSADDVGIKSVIGADTRVQITNTVSNPNWYLGRIALGCSGTLVGKRHVLTAGHCVSDGKGNWYNALDFTVAQNGNYKPWGTEKWATAMTTSRWLNNEDFNHDYALIVLKEAPHGGWLGYGNYSGGTHRITGYPGDKPLGEMWTSSSSTSSTSARIKYSMDTAPGNSGSGILDTGNTVRGIHNLGAGGGSTNSGVKIKSSVYNVIKNWISGNP